jgi:hypothetical protein
MKKFGRICIYSLSMAAILLTTSGCFPRTVTQELSDEVNLSAGGMVNVDNVAGAIVVNGADVETVSMEAETRVRVFSPFGLVNPRSYAGDVQIAVTESEGQATVTATVSTRELSWFTNLFVSVVPVADLTLTVPGASDLDVESNAGSIEVTGLDGTITVDIDAGSVECSDTTGSLDVSVDAGSIVITHNDFLASTEDIRCDVDAGSVEIGLPGNSAFSVNVDLDVGDIGEGGFVGMDARRADVVGAQASGTVGDVADPANIQVTVDVGDVDFRQLADAASPE